MLSQISLVKPKLVSNQLVGSDKKNQIPTINQEVPNAWLDVAGLSWLVLDEDYRL